MGCASLLQGGPARRSSTPSEYTAVGNITPAQTGLRYRSLQNTELRYARQRCAALRFARDPYASLERDTPAHSKMSAPEGATVAFYDLARVTLGYAQRRATRQDLNTVESPELLSITNKGWAVNHPTPKWLGP